MGLDKDDGASAATRRIRAFIVPVSLAILALLAGLSGEAGRELLRFEREAIAAGELWRLLTGHFVHLGAGHLLMNVVGLGLVSVLVGHLMSPAAWITATLVTVLGIDACFWLLEPRLEWYVGLSGVLHGFLAAGIVLGWHHGGREYPVLAVLLLAKLAWESWVGPLPGSEATAGGAVVTAAHLYGALSGLLSAAALGVRRRLAPI